MVNTEDRDWTPLGMGHMGDGHMGNGHMGNWAHGYNFLNT